MVFLWDAVSVRSVALIDMKRFLTIILAAALLIINGCRNDDSALDLPPSITLEAYATFDNAQTQYIGFTVEGGVQSITAVDVPLGWTVSPDLNDKKITVTAPAADGQYYTAAGTAVLLVSDDATHTITKPLPLQCPDYVVHATLSVMPGSISGSAAAGAYAIAVASNSTWTSEVSAGATSWCTLSSHSYTGNQAVLVSVAEQATSEQRAATITFTSGTLTQAVSVTQEGATFDTDVNTLEAGYETGNYTVNVTSNRTWTAAVSSGATWCTVSPAGAGNGAVTVSVPRNPAMASRGATITITAGTLSEEVAVTQEGHPLLAAGTNTWTFGSSALIWSDAIQIPECSQYSRTSGENTWYYYDWAYVDANKSHLCPHPWRVPTKYEMDAIDADAATLTSAWGWGGHYESIAYRLGMYWTSTEMDDTIAYVLAYGDEYGTNRKFVTTSQKMLRYQIRCVK
jgi:hypothetical protein